MDGDIIPSAPAGVPNMKAPSKKNVAKVPKSTTHRITKRAVPHHARSPTQDQSTMGSPSSLDSRHKRVWKACERCRMKKTKCDGEFPCKRCKDDGLVCTAGTRKKTEYKQLPRGYAEVLEHTQLALVATIHKLYGMVRNGQQWELGEPDLNDRGQPVIHNIATKLGCIRPNADADLPPHSGFPQDEAELAKLATELEIQQQEREKERGFDVQQGSGADGNKSDDTDSSTCNRTDRALSTSDLDPHDYRKVLGSSQNIQTLSPQSLYNDFDVSGETSPGPFLASNESYHPQQPNMNHQAPASWDRMVDSNTFNIPQQFMPPISPQDAEFMLSQGYIENDFGKMKPHVFAHANGGAMLGCNDPMIFSTDGYQ